VEKAEHLKSDLSSNGKTFLAKHHIAQNIIMRSAYTLGRPVVPEVYISVAKMITANGCTNGVKRFLFESAMGVMRDDQCNAPNLANE